jgi:predicted dehydrogenase
MPAPHLSRRSFLKSTAAALVATVGAPYVVRGGLRADKLNIGVIGVQNRAWANLTSVAHENIVALCDVDTNYLARAGDHFKGAKRFVDFREMLAADLDLDAVVVSTPDHTHAPAASMALRKGMHVYCEKPLTHNVWEARRLAELAAARGAVTQMGTQIHAGENYRRVVELIESGAIGHVREAHVWCGKGWGDGRFRAPEPPPAHLKWDLWQGPRSSRPYRQGLHPANWRRFWEYGGGTVGDMACHYMDLAFWALRLTYPTSVRAEGPPVHTIGTPSWLVAHYEFPQRGDLPPVKVHWYDGGKEPDVLKTLRRADGSPIRLGSGQLFIGDEGMLISDYSMHRLLPEEKFAKFEPPKPSIPRSIGHHREWTEACKNGGPTTCSFDYSGPLTEAVLLANVAYRAGRPLAWDAAELRATNTPEVEDLVRESYRRGWAV